MRKDWRKPDRKYVLVAKEKHGTWYYDATGDALFEAAFKLFMERVEQRWYPEESWIREVDPEPYTKEQLDELKEKFPDLHQKAWEARQKWLRAVRENRETLAAIAEIKRIQDEQDKVAAWDFLNSRSDYEYEEVDVEVLL